MRYKSDLITNCTLIFGMGALLFHLMALSYLTALSFSTVINIPDWGSLLMLNTVGLIYKSKLYGPKTGQTGPV